MRDDERKSVTTVFCDVVGFTPRTRRLTAEELHRFLTTFYDIVEHEFARFGGTSRVKRGDDAVVADFGSPNAQEDGPERAVRGGLAIVEALARRNAAEPHLGLHVRLAVTTGDALVTFDREPEQGTTWSQIHATAQRLEKQAPEDGVVVDRATYEATADHIEYEALSPLRAKGIDEPLPVWRALRPRADRGLDLHSLPGHRLVGRDGELAALVAALERAIVTRRPQRAVLVGEPGIGKTRLVLELFRYVAAQPRLITWRHGRSPPYPKHMSFWALGEIVRREAGVLETDDAATVEHKLRDAVRALTGEAPAAALEPHLLALAGVGAGGAEVLREERGARFAAWRTFLEALARRWPLVLVFEDLHWADAGLLDFLEHLLAETREAPMLVLCTVRDEPGEARDLVRRVRGWSGTLLPLRRLNGAQGRHLVAELMGETAMAPRTAEKIVGRAGGNPLFTIELVRELAGRDRRAAQPPASAGEGVPRTVREIVAARLDALPADQKRLLNAASVVGRVAGAAPLAAVTGAEPAAVAAGLGALEQQQFLAREAGAAGEPRYRFEHPLVREAAYESIPDLRKGQLHERTARWLEELSADRADRAELLAHHYRCALRLTRASGSERASLEARARVALVAAGDRAFALQAFGVADEYLSEALNLWPADDAGRPGLLLRLGRARYRSRRGGGAELAEAARSLAAAGELGLAGEAEAMLARLAHEHGRRGQVRAHIDRAAALVQDVGPTRSRLEVLVDLANLHSSARDHERTLAAASEAIELARTLGLRELEASALSSRGISRGLAGEAGGRRDLERSVAITEHMGSHLSPHCLGMLADLECQTGHLRRCFRLQARARRDAGHFADRGFITWLEAEGVAEAYWTGAWSKALAVADERIADEHFMSSYCRVVRGRIALARGDADGALADAREALRAARHAGDPQLLYPAQAFAARAEVAVGDERDGAEHAGALLREWSARRDYPASAWAVDVAYALERLDGSAALIAAADAAPAETRWLTAARAFAVRDFEAAAAGFSLVGSRPDEALARLRAARSLLEAGRDDEARAQHARAARFLRRVGATADLEAPERAFVAHVGAP